MAGQGELIDVAIVGYGPVGQALALALAQQGHSVVVLERNGALYPLPRAVGFDHETARILQSLGVADSMSRFTAVALRYEWRNADGRVLKAFSGLDRVGISGWPEKLTFCQPELERVLDARLRALGTADGAAPVEILQGWEVTGALDCGDYVQLSACPADESAATAAGREIRARFVVGCDGAGSFMRRAMGAHYEEIGFSADWLVIDITPKNPADWNADLVQICDPARPTTLVASGPGRRRLEFMLLPGETKADMNRPEVVWKLMRAWGWTPDNALLERHAVYTFGAGIANRWRVGRMLLAGDAAHLTPPFAGQGLCAGLRDVASLAWRLHAVLGGQAHDRLLDTYATERLPHVRVFTEFSVMLGGVICVLDPAAAAGRDAYMLGPGAAAEDRYPDPPLSASSVLRGGDPQAGRLSLQARVALNGGLGRFDDLLGGGFLLLGLDHDPAAALTPEQRAFLSRLGGRTIGIASPGASGVPGGVADVDGSYRAWFAELGARAVLVRPDFYVFGAGEAADLVAALAASSAWTHAPAPASLRASA
jgi:2-polyprenyl-6-methoxyphenol hydroxylase-like FAD-dependent oxidoreductase